MKMNVVVRHVAALTALGAIAFVGCDRRDEAVPYAQLGDDAVLVSVDGVSYTKGDFERDLAVRMDLLKLSLNTFSDAQLKAQRTQFRDQAIDQFVSRELLLGEAKRRRVELTNEDMLAYQENFSRGLSAKVSVGFGAVEGALGGRVTAFRASLRKDALSQKVSALIRREAAATAAPSDEEVARTLREAEASNRAFAVTNRATYALATNAWKSIVAGNDFATVGKKLREMNRHVAYLPGCGARDPAVTGLAEGEMSPPLEAEGGVAIYRANAKPGARNRYSCIYFALAPIYVIESPDEARKTIFRANVDAAHSAKLDELRRKADIRYPYGKNPFHD